MNGSIVDTIQYPHRLSMFVTIIEPTKNADQIIHISSWIILIFFGFLTNGLFLFTLLKNGSLRKTAMNRLLMVLSTIDILILINELLFIVYPFFVKPEDLLTSFNTPLVVTTVWVYTYLEHLSVGILIVIPYERFRAICFPLQFIVDKAHVKRYLVIVSLITTVFVAFYAYCFYFVPGSALMFFLILIILPSLVPITISSILYTILIVVLFRSGNVSDNIDTMASKRRKQYKIRVVIVLAINSVVYFIFNVLRKYYDTRLATVFRENIDRHNGYGFISKAWHVASYMAIFTILNSTVNPVIYSMGSQQYRKALFRALRINGCRRDKSKENHHTSRFPRLPTLSQHLWIKRRHMERSNNLPMLKSYRRNDD